VKSALAIFAHPDDIEFVAAGTLLRLKEHGWSIHYMNVSNGCLGSTETDTETTAAIRLEEARRSAAILGATFYPPICRDLEIFYTSENLRKLSAVVRQANPSIVLTHARDDYMEDHMVTCRLAVTAAFARSVPNYTTLPDVPMVPTDVAIYHAQPHGNRTPDCKVYLPEKVVVVDDVLPTKLKMLECHQSQQNWLKSTQKMNSYVQTMLELTSEVARFANLNAKYAEGWTQHLHLGFGPKGYDPLGEIAVNLT
jgi:LmbE family N-acetylglucosaminyl deacetylase